MSIIISSACDVDYTFSALSSPFPHSRFSSVHLNLYFTSTLRRIDLETMQTLSSSSTSPSLLCRFQLHPQLLNSRDLLFRTLDRLLECRDDLDDENRVRLAGRVGRYISELQNPPLKVDADIQIVRTQFVAPTPGFHVIDGAYVIDAVDVRREKGSQLAVTKFIKKWSFECGDERQEDCSICFGNYRKERRAVKTECNHMFHQNCISKWLQNNNTCPLCRKRVY